MKRALRSRLGLALLLYGGALAAYGLTGHLTVGRSSAVPTFWLDRAIPYEPLLAPVYLAYFPYLLWVLLRIRHRPSFGRTVAIGAAVVASSVAAFLVFPTHVERAELARSGWSEELVRWLRSIDPPTNALPSLHASLTVIASTLAVREGLLSRWGAVLVCAAILYAAAALDQHYVIDLAAGALLGAAALLGERLVSRTPIPRPETTS